MQEDPHRGRQASPGCTTHAGGRTDLRGIFQEVGAADGLTLVTLFSEGFINFGAESEIPVISLQRTNKTRKQLLTPGKTKFYVKKGQLTIASRSLQKATLT